MTYFLTFIGLFIISAIGVEVFRRWSLRRGILDHPNERSSHESPTPRGAGLVVFIICLAAYTVFGLYGFYPLSWGYISGALLLAIVSWLDDLIDLSFINRMIAHAAAVGLLLGDVGFFHSVNFPYFGPVHLGVFGFAITFFWIFGFLNAFNFMDGIDGLAGSQGFVAAVGWFAAGMLFSIPIFSVYGIVIAAAVLGFLIFNWQPAKIFMGDVGSCFLGFTLAAMPLFGPRDGGPNLFLLAGVFVWPFVFDVIFTFIRRIFLKHRVWRPHREHIYQRMVISGFHHATVTAFYGILAAVGVLCGILNLMFHGRFALLILFYFVGTADLTNRRFGSIKRLT